jgi:anaerobic selenocysteine-containing dehydrogenase
MQRLDFVDGDVADLITAIDQATERSVLGLRIVEYGIPTGCCAAYYPECNPLFPLNHHDEKSKTPSYKLLPVFVTRSQHRPID